MMIGPEQDPKSSGKSGKKKGKAKKAKRRAAAVDLETPTVDPVTEPVVGEGLAPVAAPADGAESESAGSAEDAGAPSPGVPPAFGPPLLAWIDRVQEHVDYLLTLTDMPAAVPSVEPEATAEPSTTAGPETTAAPEGDASSAGDEPEAAPRTEPVEPEAESTAETAEEEAHRLSLAEAWALRLEAEGQQAEQPVPEPEEEPIPAPREDPFAEPEAWDEPEATPGPLDDEPFEPIAARLSAVLVARELIARGLTLADVRRRLREGYGVDDPDAVLSRVAA